MYQAPVNDQQLNSIGYKGKIFQTCEFHKSRNHYLSDEAVCMEVVSAGENVEASCQEREATASTLVCGSHVRKSVKEKLVIKH